MRSESTHMWVAQVDLATSPVPIGVIRPQDPEDTTARVLVRHHGQPLGFVTLTCNKGETSNLASAVSTQLPGAIDASERCSHPAHPERREPIGVVVCTRNNPEGLAGCIRRLRDLRYGTFEVVVVDNAPRDEATRECFDRETRGDERFRYVREGEPGLSRARNRGLAEMGARFVAFTDDDALVDPWWLDGIADGFDRHPGTGCVTGLVPPAELDHPTQVYFDGRYSWSSHMQPRIFDLDTHQDDSPLYPYTPALFGTGANFAFDRELIEGLGGFDTSLGAGTPSGGGEDLDAFVRVLQAGRALVFEPSAIVWHVHRSTPRTLRRQLFFYGAGLTAFVTKHLVDPRTTRQVLTRLWNGVLRVSRLWGAESKGGRAPAMLIAIEAAGMIAGPFAYARGRRLR